MSLLRYWNNFTAPVVILYDRIGNRVAHDYRRVAMAEALFFFLKPFAIEAFGAVHLHALMSAALESAHA